MHLTFQFCIVEDELVISGNGYVPSPKLVALCQAPFLISRTPLMSLWRFRCVRLGLTTLPARFILLIWHCALKAEAMPHQLHDLRFTLSPPRRSSGSFCGAEDFGKNLQLECLLRASRGPMLWKLPKSWPAYDPRYRQRHRSTAEVCRCPW